MDLKSGYSAVTDQSKFDSIVDWLKNKELDLERAVVIRKGEKHVLFGMAYKIVFKTLTNYL